MQNKENNLTSEELVNLVKNVFSLDGEKSIAVLSDFPDDRVPDNANWKKRRQMAFTWVRLLDENKDKIEIDEVKFVYYRNVHTNNADLPPECYYCTKDTLPDAKVPSTKYPVSFETVFEKFDIIIAPTEFSTTAPLKIAAKKHEFKAATMPGFKTSMIPALRLDYTEVGRRVDKFYKLLTNAHSCKMVFTADNRDYDLFLDLRHRKAHASAGIFPHAGQAGNLPSGEAYIVPYEGEIKDVISKTSGQIPVQLGDDVVIYQIVENKAVEVVSDNDTSKIESQKLKDEPAYGNLAELGLGVLGDFGLEPTGEILLDEKLGIHIAFGRSEHFGGQVGPEDFSAPDKVVHIDRVYIPKIQPKVTIKKAILTFENEPDVLLMQDGQYKVNF